MNTESILDTPLSSEKLGEIAWKFLLGTLPPDQDVEPEKALSPTSDDMRSWLSDRAVQFGVPFDAHSTEVLYMHNVAWEIAKKKSLDEGVHIRPAEIKGWYEDIQQMQVWGFTPHEWAVFTWTLIQFVVQEQRKELENFVASAPKGHP